MFCILEQPLVVTLTCGDDNREVKATIPAHQGAISSPIRFFVAEDGSTFYGDTQKNGKGTQLVDNEKIYVKDQLAVKATVG